MLTFGSVLLLLGPALISLGAARIRAGACYRIGTLLDLTFTQRDVRVWDLAGMSLVREIKADDDVLWSVTFSPDARRLAVASSDEVVSVWDLATGRPQAAFTGHSGGATDMAFLADGVTLVIVKKT